MRRQHALLGPIEGRIHRTHSRGRWTTSPQEPPSKASNRASRCWSPAVPGAEFPPGRSIGPSRCASASSACTRQTTNTNRGRTVTVRDASSTVADQRFLQVGCARIWFPCDHLCRSSPHVARGTRCLVAILASDQVGLLTNTRSSASSAVAAKRVVAAPTNRVTPKSAPKQKR